MQHRCNPGGAVACGFIACFAAAACGRVGIDKLAPLGHGGGPAPGGAAQAGSAGGNGVTGGSGGAAGAGDSSGALDYCNALPALARAPTIDGLLDPGLLLTRVDPVGWRGTEAIPEGTALSYVAAWRPDGLYFFLRVQDPDRNPADPADPVWYGDAVEIYVDSDGVFPAPLEWDEPGARQFVIAAPVDDTTPSTRAEHFVEGSTGIAWDTERFAAVPTPQGYDAEAFIAAADLGLGSWGLEAGDSVGIDLAHDVSVPPGQSGAWGNRDSQYFLRILEPSPGAGTDLPFLNENAFCAATLLGP